LARSRPSNGRAGCATVLEGGSAHGAPRRHRRGPHPGPHRSCRSVAPVGCTRPFRDRFHGGDGDLPRCRLVEHRAVHRVPEHRNPPRAASFAPYLLARGNGDGAGHGGGAVLAIPLKRVVEPEMGWPCCSRSTSSSPRETWPEGRSSAGDSGHRVRQRVWTLGLHPSNELRDEPRWRPHGD